MFSACAAARWIGDSLGSPNSLGMHAPAQNKNLEPIAKLCDKNGLI
jgi:hypothetical protein